MTDAAFGAFNARRDSRGSRPFGKASLVASDVDRIAHLARKAETFDGPSAVDSGSVAFVRGTDRKGAGMVKIIKRHSYGLMFLLGLLFALGMASGWLGKAALDVDPIPYTFEIDELETGWRDDGYHFAGVVHKRECERLPAPAGFAIEVTPAVGAEPYRATWRSVLGRPNDESRPAGSAPMHILIDLPSNFAFARIWTAHACPAVGEGSVVMVRTLLHEILGNVIEQRVLSPSEVTK